MRYRAIGIFDGCTPLKMGVFRKPRYSKDDVGKATYDFFNNLPGRLHRTGKSVRLDLRAAGRTN